MDVELPGPTFMDATCDCGTNFCIYIPEEYFCESTGLNTGKHIYYARKEDRIYAKLGLIKDMKQETKKKGIVFIDSRKNSVFNCHVCGKLFDVYGEIHQNMCEIKKEQGG